MLIISESNMKSDLLYIILFWFGLNTANEWFRYVLVQAVRKMEYKKGDDTIKKKRTGHCQIHGDWTERKGPFDCIV